MNYKFGLLLGLVVLTVLFACRKETFITDAGAQVEFSADTVLFDTVFTSIGSTTQLLKVYNPHNERIKMSAVFLERGSSSPYRINVDGVNGFTHSNIEIPDNDSIFIFIEVTIDPNAAGLPFIEEDFLVFMTNGNEQRVNLAAWGQNAHFHGSLNNFEYLDCDAVWNNDLPHVVYGIVGVQANCNLTINQGSQIYFHSASGLYVDNGSLTVNGELGNEVCFQGDRLEPFYENLAGQWGIELEFAFETDFGIEYATVSRGGLWLSRSTGSTINYAIIKNGVIGLQVDTFGTLTDDALTITNTIVQNMSAIGLFAQGATINGSNDLIVNCGQNCAAFTIGGAYNFDHCTFANYWSEGNRQAPAFIMNNYYEDVNGVLQVRELVEAQFRNCILYGNNAQLSDFNEFVIDLEQEELQNYYFQSCFVDTDITVSDDGNHFSDMRNNQNEPPFLDPFIGDFDLPTSVNSSLTAGQVGGIGADIKSETRNASTALGCYEAN